MKFLPTTVAAIAAIHVPLCFAERKFHGSIKKKGEKADSIDESTIALGVPRRLKSDSSDKKAKSEKTTKSSKSSKSDSLYAITKCFFPQDPSTELLAPTSEACSALATEAGLAADTKIGTGSCISADIGILADVQGYACIDFTENVEIGQGSCVGTAACEAMVDTNIGSNSCTGTYACYNLDDADINGGSCSGAEVVSACSFLNDTSVGANSCKGDGACTTVERTDIGDGSCFGYDACAQMYDSDIGNGACIGFSTCAVSDFLTVGNQGCIGLEACYDAYGNEDNTIKVEQNSCVGTQSCKDIDANAGTQPILIEAGSCIGYRSCYQINFNVGKDSCVGSFACQCGIFPDNFLSSVVCGNKICDNSCNIDNPACCVG